MSDSTVECEWCSYEVEGSSGVYGVDAADWSCVSPD